MSIILCGHQVDDNFIIIMTNNRSELGFLTENLACRYLEKKGYRLVEVNYRKPWGEIDIIAEKEGIVVFVEVKANRKIIIGFEPELRADYSKIHKVVRTAKTYLVDKKYPEDQEWQVDVISISLDEPRDIAKIRHYKNIDT